jgi:hypothetical protein
MVCENDSVLEENGCSRSRFKEFTVERPIQSLLEECQIAWSHVQPFIEPDLQGEENGSIEYDCNDADSFAPAWLPKIIVLLSLSAHD